MHLHTVPIAPACDREEASNKPYGYQKTTCVMAPTELEQRLSLLPYNPQLGSKDIGMERRKLAIGLAVRKQGMSV